jgi:hypothetical protein
LELSNRKSARLELRMFENKVVLIDSGHLRKNAENATSGEIIA